MCIRDSLWIHGNSGCLAQKAANVAQLEQIDLFADDLARLTETEGVKSIIAMQLVTEDQCLVIEGWFHRKTSCMCHDDTLPLIHRQGD